MRRRPNAPWRNCAPSVRPRCCSRAATWMKAASSSTATAVRAVKPVSPMRARRWKATAPVAPWPRRSPPTCAWAWRRAKPAPSRPITSPPPCTTGIVPAGARWWYLATSTRLLRRVDPQPEGNSAPGSRFEVATVAVVDDHRADRTPVEHVVDPRQDDHPAPYCRPFPFDADIEGGVAGRPGLVVVVGV